MKITVEEIKQSRPVIESLVLKSFECDIYLVEVNTGEGKFQVCDEAGKPRVFRSQLGAKSNFKGLGIRKTLLTHESPYDEMIGLDVDQVESMSVKVSNPDDDYS